jgi:hypothetical protein
MPYLERAFLLSDFSQKKPFKLDDSNRRSKCLRYNFMILKETFLSDWFSEKFEPNF